MATYKGIDEPVDTRSSLMMIWMKALRLHHWSKNVLLFVPLALIQQLDDPEKLQLASLGFVIFGLITSGSYLFNDLVDLDHDRYHPEKCERAIASGNISIRSALIVGGLLVVIGLTAAFWLTVGFGLCMLSYVAITITYSFWLKSEPLFDTFTIGVLFSIRLIAGMVILEQPISIWLSGFAFTLFTSLALAKRHAELVATRSVPGNPLSGRGYRPDDIVLILTTGIGNALLAFLIMLIYFAFQALPTGLYDTIAWLYVIPLTILSWTFRIWIYAHRGELHEDPVIFALTDKISWVHGGVVLVFWFAAVKM